MPRHALKRLARATSAFLGGLMSGMASSITIYETPQYRRLEGSDADRLRGDFERVVGDLSKITLDAYNSPHWKRPRQ
jgi:hypothetical protein